MKSKRMDMRKAAVGKCSEVLQAKEVEKITVPDKMLVQDHSLIQPTYLYLTS